MSTELKPCPFCGGEASLINTFALGCECKSVQCIRCKAKVNNFSAQTKEISAQLATAAWNRRVNDESPELPKPVLRCSINGAPCCECKPGSPCAVKEDAHG